VISVTECLLLFSLHSSAISIPCVCMYHMFQPIAAIIRYTEPLQWPFFLSAIHPNTYLMIAAIGESMQYMQMHGLVIPELCQLNNNKCCLTHNMKVQYNISNNSIEVCSLLHLSVLVCLWCWLPRWWLFMCGYWWVFKWPNTLRKWPLFELSRFIPMWMWDGVHASRWTEWTGLCRLVNRRKSKVNHSMYVF
jgi:hypothetical protein